MASYGSYGQPLRQEHVAGLGWCNVYQDVHSSQPEFSFINVPLTPAEAAQLCMSPRNGEAEALGELLQQGTQDELVAARDMLRASQDHDEPPDEEEQMFQAAADRRSELDKQHDSSRSSDSMTGRWGNVRPNPIIQNCNTAKATRVAVNAFTNYLKDARDIYTTPEEFATRPQKEIVRELEAYALQLRKQDGSEYARSAYIAMMMGVIRYINSKYHERRIKKDANPPPDDIKLDSGMCTALKHNMDATCRELHQKGKGVVQQQQTFSPEEFKKLLDYLSSMQQTGYKHLLVGYLALALQFGGRVSDYPKFKRSDVVRSTDAQGHPKVSLTLPVTLKQNQGGLKQSRGNQYMLRHPTVPVYPNKDVPSLCFHAWLDKDDEYRARVKDNFLANKNNKVSQYVECDRLFLQPAWHRKATKATNDSAQAPNGTLYKDELQNAPAGQSKFDEMLKLVCLKAGVDPRTNHALRHEFIESCYEAGMSEVETSTFTRHTSVEGLRNYARVSDDVMEHHAALRHKNMASKIGNLQAPAPAPAPPPTVPSWDDDLDEFYDCEDEVPAAPVKTANPSSSSAMAGLSRRPPIAPPPPPVPPTAVQPYMPSYAPPVTSTAQPAGLTLNLNFGGLFQGMPQAPAPGMMPYGAAAAGNHSVMGYAGGFHAGNAMLYGNTYSSMLHGASTAALGYTGAGFGGNMNVGVDIGNSNPVAFGYSSNDGGQGVVAMHAVQDGYYRQPDFDNTPARGRLPYHGGQPVKYRKVVNNRKFVIDDDDDDV